MNPLISDIVAVIYTGLLHCGGGYTLKEVHDFARYETSKKSLRDLAQQRCSQVLLQMSRLTSKSKEPNCYRWAL